MGLSVPTPLVCIQRTCLLYDEIRIFGFGNIGSYSKSHFVIAKERSNRGNLSFRLLRLLVETRNDKRIVTNTSTKTL